MELIVASTKRPMWTDLWELSSDMVNCKECHAGQHLAHREMAIAHKPICSREGIGEYPYIELFEVLKMMHYADQLLPSSGLPPAWMPPKIWLSALVEARDNPADKRAPSRCHGNKQ